MAFRGGRGRGRGGYGRGYNAKQEAFTLFPADVALPDRKCVALNDDFVRWNNKLQFFFENSPYFVEDSTSQDCQSRDIERYSDSLKPRNNKRKSLSDYIKLGPGYFPQDLVGKGRKQQQQKKVKWDAGVDGKRLDFLEQLEKKAKTNGEKGNDEDEEEEDDEEEDEEYSTDGDYEQNQDFDDDDDDFNDNDDGDDEPFY